MGINPKLCVYMKLGSQVDVKTSNRDFGNRWEDYICGLKDGMYSVQLQSTKMLIVFNCV